MDKIKKIIDYKKIIIFLGILLLFLTLDYLLIIGYYSISGPIKSDSNIGIIFTFIKYFVLIFIFIIQYHEYLKEKLLDFKKHFLKYFEISFKYWLLGFVIMIISNVIISHFFPGLGKNEENVQLLIKKIPVIAFVLTTIFAPFVEEMIFRKYLQDSIKNKYLFMIISGLLFGFVHVMSSKNPLEYLLIIPYGSLGFMFAKTISETDNVYSTVLMHMLHNGVLTLLSIWVI